MKKWLKRLMAGVLALALLVVVMATWGLSSSEIELSQGGVHQRLMVPVGGGRMMAFPVYSGTGDAVSIANFFDGPVVRRGAGSAWSASWFCENRAFSREGEGDTLTIDCAGGRYAFDLHRPGMPDAVAPMPARVTVLSDLEGNASFLDAALPALGIVDVRGDWSYGRGHLVILGDSVDRGRDVFAVLWRLHGLSLQAQQAGGAVHVLLGNHEQYMLRTNNSRAHPEHIYALGEMDHGAGGYRTAFAVDTVIGEWLRRQPVVVKLGSVLFVHGGVSRAVAEVTDDPVALNASMRDYWAQWAAAQAGSDQPAASPMLDAVLGPLGVTQYRGYLMPLQGRYGLVSAQDLGFALKRFAADKVVVAHTPVDRIEQLFDGRVIAVDVNEPGAQSQALVFDGNVAKVVPLPVMRHLDRRAPVRLRKFELSRASDRAVLWAMIGQARALAALPHPY